MPFTFDPTLNITDYLYTAALGLPGTRFVFADKGKLVKLIASDTYGLASAGDEIEAAVHHVEDTIANGTVVNGTVNSGSALGTIQIGSRLEVWLEDAVPVGNFVVCGTPVPLGTKLTLGSIAGVNGLPSVKAGSPTKFKWRVISGTGAAGSRAIIELI